MKVKELAELLSKFDPEAELGILYDGADRMNLDRVWISRRGKVLICDQNHTVYETEDRPADAPTTEEERYWSTPELKPGEPGFEWPACEICGSRSLRCGCD